MTAPALLGLDDALAEFYVTFGQRYSRERHPSLPAAHPDGWVVVVAPNMDAARHYAHLRLGSHWSGIYDAEDHNPDLYPLGELARIGVGQP